MKLFVTGATGFIGSCLAEHLLKEGHSVTILVRDQKTIPELRSRGFKVVNGDLSDTDKILAGMDGCEWVFHLAAHARPDSKDPELPYRINVKGTENILASALKSEVGSVVVTSTAGTMGYSKDGSIVDESTSSDHFFHTEYERTKWLAENASISASNEKTRVVVVNPTRVFGPGKLTKSNSVTTMIKLYGRGIWRLIPGDGTAVGNYAYIDDVVKGHILAAQNGRPGERYILGGENLTFNEFFRMLGQAYGVNRKLFYVSSVNMKRINNITGKLLAMAGKPPLLTDSWIEKYLQNWSLSSQKAIDELGYSVTPFHLAVERTIEWLDFFRSPRPQGERKTDDT